MPEHETTRRGFLRAGLAGAGGALVGRTATAPAAPALLKRPAPCTLSSQTVFNTNEYFICAMGPGDNDEHCGTPTIVYCAEDKNCLANVTRGPILYNLPPVPPYTYCANDPTNPDNCAWCSAASTGTDSEPKNNVICVPD